jgi:O-antigen/teichoic acid export membrane protein
MAVSMVVGLLLVAAICRGAISRQPTPPPPEEDGNRPTVRGLRDGLAFGAFSHANSLAWFLHYRVDMFIVSYLVGDMALGFYATSVALAEKLYLVPSIVGTVLFPTVARGAGGETQVNTARAVRLTLLVTLGMAVALGVVAYPLVVILYGGEFVPAIRPLWILLPGAVALAVGRVISADLMGRGRPVILLVLNMGATILNLVLNLLWIPVWGIEGAAVATAVSYTAGIPFLAVAYRRISGGRIRDLVVPRRSDWSDLKAVVRQGAELVRRREPSGE